MTIQVSQLFRRGVVRPLNEEAAVQLRTMFVESPIRCEWLPILGEQNFIAIWRSGVFQRIADACQAPVRDYEEALLELASISDAMTAVEATPVAGHSNQVQAFLTNLAGLLCDARRAGTLVLFVL